MAFFRSPRHTRRIGVPSEPAPRAGGIILRPGREQKYGTLDPLNRAWYRQYAAWDEAEPNRLSTILFYTDFIDWKQFVADKLGEDLRDRYQAVKRAAPNAVAPSHAAGIGLFSSPLWWEGQSDDWPMTQQVDYYGTSFYRPDRAERLLPDGARSRRIPFVVAGVDRVGRNPG